MKQVIVFLVFILSLFCLFSPELIFAQDSPAPTPQPQIQYVNQFTVDNQPSTIVGLLKTFITGFDSFFGGFIFYTPNPMSNPIVLKDNSQIPGMTKYRNMFYQIAVPFIAIIVSGFAIGRLGSENLYSLKSFAIRLLVVTALFITTPSILSYSIQFNNLLVSKISHTQTLTSFLNDYFDQTSARINNTNSEQYGIPKFDLSLAGGVLNSLGKFIVQILLFVITFLFLIGGLLYIGFQFVIRFAALLFLGVLYPIILPFALSEKTEQIVITFFKSWFAFLIAQPAFVLGFSIATDIFTSLLKANGPSVGLLFFYTGFLFFLGGVNVLVGRIFGEFWGSFTTNMQAMIATRATTSQIIGAPKTIRTIATTASGILGRNKKQGESESDTGGDTTNNPQNGRPNGHNRLLNAGATSTNTTSSQRNRGPFASQTPVNSGSFSSQLSQHGYQVDLENRSQGIVAVSGTAYAYDNPKTGLTAIYTSRQDAVSDGAILPDIRQVQLHREQFIDPSLFPSERVNPHNMAALAEAKRIHQPAKARYLSSANHPKRVKRFLALNRERNRSLGISGVVIKRYGALGGKDQIIRLYTDQHI